MKTKQDEIDAVSHIERSYSQYPYLSELLAEVGPLLKEAIRNDFTVTSLAELWKQKAEMEKEIKAERIKAQEELAAMRKELAQLKREADGKREELAEVQRIARRLANG